MQKNENKSAAASIVEAIKEKTNLNSSFSVRTSTENFKKLKLVQEYTGKSKNAIINEILTQNLNDIINILEN